MRKLPIIFILLLAAVIPSCKLDPVTDAWEYYKEWREGNQAWLNEQIAKTNDDGTPYYNKVIPEFDHNAYVLIRYLNDRSKTEGNLTPLTSSTVDMKYIGRTYDDVAFDSSYLSTTPADSIYRTRVTDLIEGWTIALTNMRVGDSCEVIVPYQYAYGNVTYGSIKPYSNLIFHIKLVDIPGYEKPAY